jgi:hypothetical protein
MSPEHTPHASEPISQAINPKHLRRRTISYVVAYFAMIVFFAWLTSIGPLPSLRPITPIVIGLFAGGLVVSYVALSRSPQSVSYSVRKQINGFTAKRTLKQMGEDGYRFVGWAPYSFYFTKTDRKWETKKAFLKKGSIHSLVDQGWSLVGEPVKVFGYNSCYFVRELSNWH